MVPVPPILRVVVSDAGRDVVKYGLEVAGESKRDISHRTVIFTLTWYPTCCCNINEPASLAATIRIGCYTLDNPSNRKWYVLEDKV